MNKKKKSQPQSINLFNEHAEIISVVKETLHPTPKFYGRKNIDRFEYQHAHLIAPVTLENSVVRSVFYFL